MIDRAVIENALPAGSESAVAHYTRIGSLRYFLPEGPPPTGWRSAWATPVQFLNDRLELVLGLETLFDAAEQSAAAPATVRSTVAELLASGGSLDTDAFQMSSIGDQDELGQTR